MNKRYIPQNEEFSSWEHLLEELETHYTISLKDVCVLLKASRSWVNKYIRPYVRTIYISNGSAYGKTNWVKIASLTLNKPFTESIWFHEDDFYEYVLSNIVSITKQVKKVPKTFLMESEEKRKYFEEYKNIKNKLETTKNIKEKVKLMRELDICDLKYLKEDEKKLVKHRANSAKRTETEKVPVTLDNVNISEWQAVHDIKKYGDIDETIYRNLFNEGSIRIELKFQDINGKYGTKIYYVSDQEPIIVNNGNEEYYYIQQKYWNMYIEEKKK